MAFVSMFCEMILGNFLFFRWMKMAKLADSVESVLLMNVALESSWAATLTGITVASVV